MKHLIESRDVDQDLPVVRNRGPLNIPFSYTRYKQNTFRVYGPKLFNRLHCISPITLRTSISKFKTQVRQLIENHSEVNGSIGTPTRRYIGTPHRHTGTLAHRHTCTPAHAHTRTPAPAQAQDPPSFRPPDYGPPPPTPLALSPVQIRH